MLPLQISIYFLVTPVILYFIVRALRINILNSLLLIIKAVKNKLTKKKIHKYHNIAQEFQFFARLELLKFMCLTFFNGINSRKYLRCVSSDRDINLVPVF